MIFPRLWPAVASAATVLLLTTACSSAGSGSPPDTGGSHFFDGAGGDGGGGGGGGGGGTGDGGTGVEVVATGVVPRVTDMQGSVVFAKVHNTTSSEAPVILGWTGYSAAGAKLSSDEDGVGPQDTSSAVLPPNATIYIAEPSPFHAKPAKLVATPHDVVIPQSDAAMKVTPVTVFTDEFDGPSASTFASHPGAADPELGDSWGDLTSLTMICTDSSGTVAGIGFLHSPTTDDTANSFRNHPKVRFTGPLVDPDLLKHERCTASPYQWLADVGA